MISGLNKYLAFKRIIWNNISYNYILNNYNIDDNEIITVNEVANIWRNMLKHISFTSGNQV